MSKAILITDMPEIDKNTKNGCRNCKFAKNRMTLSEEYLCVITDQSAYVYDMNCPLKPLPSKMKADYDTITSCEVTEKVVAMGWNACIDEILGEEENG